MGPSDRWNSVSCQLPDSCPRPGNNSPARPTADPTQYRRPGESRKSFATSGRVSSPIPVRDGIHERTRDRPIRRRRQCGGGLSRDAAGRSNALAGHLSGRTSGACDPCPSAGKDNAGLWPWTTTASALLVLAPRGAQVFFMPAARGVVAGMTRAGSGSVRGDEFNNASPCRIPMAARSMSRQPNSVPGATWRIVFILFLNNPGAPRDQCATGFSRSPSPRTFATNGRPAP